MNKKGNWVTMPKRERIFLVSLVIYVILIFMPWTYEVSFLNLSLMVWGTYLLTFSAPIISIFLIMSERSGSESEEINKNT